jgi:hypothetical protein
MYLFNFQGANTGQGTNWTIHTTTDVSATIGECILQTRAISATGNVTGNFTNGSFDRCATTMIVFTDGSPLGPILGTSDMAFTTTGTATNASAVLGPKLQMLRGSIRMN